MTDDIRYGANGQPMVSKKKPEVIQEILEENPNSEEEDISWNKKRKSSDEKI